MKNKTIDFQKHKAAKDTARNRSDDMAQYLKENGPDKAPHWNPDSLKEGMEQIFYESELRNDKTD